MSMVLYSAAQGEVCIKPNVMVYHSSKCFIFSNLRILVSWKLENSSSVLLLVGSSAFLGVPQESPPSAWGFLRGCHLLHQLIKSCQGREDNKRGRTLKILDNVTVQLVFLKHINSMNKELFDSSFRRSWQDSLGKLLLHSSAFNSYISYNLFYTATK